MSDSASRKQALEKIWRASIDAVAGYQAVANALAEDIPFAPDLVLAVSKAAVGMCQGALDHLPPCDALVVTKYEHADADIRSRDRVEVIESAHPVPDQQSLEAGNVMLDRIPSLPEGGKALLLVSGGALALAEALPEGTSLEDLQSVTDEMIAGGKTIAQINARRKQTSLIKDGKLIEHFGGSEIRVYAISVVEGDSLSVIGSGIGDCHRARAVYSARVIASNLSARQRAEETAIELVLRIHLNQESLYGDVYDLAREIGGTLQDAEPGVYIWGGEPTVVLPSSPGRGGRNQSLALALAEHLVDRRNISVLVAGTDGLTHAAGGIVDADTWCDPVAAQQALDFTVAGDYLEQHNSLFVIGSTNTNVMDLAIAIVD